MITLLPLYLLNSNNIISFIENYKSFRFTFTYFFFAFKLCQDVLYIYLIIRKLKVHRLFIRNEYSNTDRINLSWISNLLYAYVLVILIYIVLSLFFYVIIPEHLFIVIDIVNLFIILFVFFFGYMGLTSGTRVNCIGHNENQAKYERSSLTDEMSDDYSNRIIQFMEKNMYHRDSELTLKKLADELSISQHNLSQVINQRLNKNFYEFVNCYRIEEAKILLVDPVNRDMTIIEILLNCGFKSKSVFNSLFKNNTGMTPTQYRRQYTRK